MHLEVSAYGPYPPEISLKARSTPSSGPCAKRNLYYITSANIKASRPIAHLDRNTRQLATHRRCTRKSPRIHFDKPYSRIVQPLGQDNRGFASPVCSPLFLPCDQSLPRHTRPGSFRHRPSGDSNTFRRGSTFRRHNCRSPRRTGHRRSLHRARDIRAPESGRKGWRQGRNHTPPKVPAPRKRQKQDWEQPKGTS